MKVYKVIILLLFVLVFVRNIRTLNSQDLSSSSIINISSTQTNDPLDFKIYVNSDKTISFGIPFKTNAVIKIVNSNGEIINSYLLENINTGSYNISLLNTLKPGDYEIILNSGEKNISTETTDN